MVAPVNDDLTQEELRARVHYDPSTGVFTYRETEHYAGREAGSLGTNGYVKIGFRRGARPRRTYLAHRLAWLYVYGEWPSGVIDHVNRRKTDNRIDNLRDTNMRTNTRNTGRVMGACVKTDDGFQVSVKFTRTFPTRAAALEYRATMHDMDEAL